jgi:hypothetical protein
MISLRREVHPCRTGGRGASHAFPACGPTGGLAASSAPGGDHRAAVCLIFKAVPGSGGARDLYLASTPLNLRWPTVGSLPRAAASARWEVRVHDDGATSADSPEEPDTLGTELRRRGEEIAARIEQLHQRSQKLAADCRPSSTADEVATAQTQALRAHQRALRAHLRAAQRHDQAAQAHLRLAAWYEQQGDSQRAQAHREAASADHAKAAVDTRLAREEKPPMNAEPFGT